MWKKKSKSPGAYCEFLPASKNAFIIANFSPSFNAVIALIHEMGHALNEYLQFINDHGPQEMNRRDFTGLESDFASTWISSVHYFKYPFYKIEYAISELGALRLLQIYKKDPNRAVELYKKGASTDLSESIAQVYHDTEVEFDFSSQTLETIATIVERLIEELQ